MRVHIMEILIVKFKMFLLFFQGELFFINEKNFF